MKLPTEVARNHTPIINPPILAGASTVIALKPTGLNTSSPMVCRKYVVVSHIGLASTPSARAGGIRIAKPRPASTRPQANLVGADGSVPLAAILTQTHAITGANRIRKNEFIDWNQLLGKSNPRTLL